MGVEASWTADERQETMPGFGAATRAWFLSRFQAPTPVQVRGWARIAAGDHALLIAPTGSGKTLAAFLWALDHVAHTSAASPGVRVLYLSPLKALGYDVERNLRGPLDGIRATAAASGGELLPVGVSVRTGDTSQRDRERFRRRPSEILITTPESLFLMLSSRARETLRGVETVIIDEIHALAGTKRGVHLALSLERLSLLCGREPQRIGLSATVSPAAEIARFLSGGRPVEVVDASERPNVALSVLWPSGAAPSAAGGETPMLWEAVAPQLVEMVRSNRSTLIFVNSRRLCERLVAKLGELAGDPGFVKAHHGSLSRAQRLEVEGELKAGRLRGIIATSSLELGIDMAAVDLVVQVGSPGAVARGLQRVGRAGHAVGELSRGVFVPRHPAELLECAAVVRGMRDGAVEPTRVPLRCLDVLAQQIVAMCTVEAWNVAALLTLARRAWPYRDLSRASLDGVLELLSGRYASEAGLADLRPRLAWDRSNDRIEALAGARHVVTANAGTIPDRGLFRVSLGEGGPRVGELDEEMVHETRRGDVVVLGASAWRVEEITRDQVVVSPAPGESGRLPFWRGDAAGRHPALGRAIGVLHAEIVARDEDHAVAWLGSVCALDPLAAAAAVAYVHQQAASSAVPTDRVLVAERFRDEVGDWRVCLLSPWGVRVHAALGLVIQALAARRSGATPLAVWSDEGIALRWADSDEPPSLRDLLPGPDDLAELGELIADPLGQTPMFSGHFRENAARALLLVRRRPGERTALWAQRRRAEDLLAAVRGVGDFPIVLETLRECLQDVFDLPALEALLAGLHDGGVRLVETVTPRPSPMARNLVWEWVASWMYQYDLPLAERRAGALALDRELLRDLLGQEELRTLLDPAVLAEVEAELQGLHRPAGNADELLQLLRRVGDLNAEEIAARSVESPADWLSALMKQGRVIEVRLAGEPRWIAAEEAARYQVGLGVELGPRADPTSETPAEALRAILLRFARGRGPFLLEAPAARYKLPLGAVEAVLRDVESRDLVRSGGFRPGGSGLDWCDAEVLRRLRRRTLHRLRAEIAPVEPAALARFCARWHGLGRSGASGPALDEALLRLEGCPLPFAVLEREILPARVPGYQPRWLDERSALGGLVWLGCGTAGTRDALVVLARRERVPLLFDAPVRPAALSALAGAVLDHLEQRGAAFQVELQLGLVARPSLAELEAALWELVRAGLVHNDAFEPLRTLAAPRRPGRGPKARGGRWAATSRLFALPSDPTERALARAMSLLDRYGVLSRAAAADEEQGLREAGLRGPSTLTGALRAMEEAGRIRRGAFVVGADPIQHALPLAVERLRAARNEVDGAMVLSVLDPANPWGMVVPWPEGTLRPARAAGARLVTVNGVPALVLERGDRLGVITPEDDVLAVAARALCASQGRMRITQIDGLPARQHPRYEALRAAGFGSDPRGLVWAQVRGASGSR